MKMQTWRAELREAGKYARQNSVSQSSPLQHFIRGAELEKVMGHSLPDCERYPSHHLSERGD